MTQEIVKSTGMDAQLVEKVVLHGDLSELSPQERVSYYARVCESLGLNPFTRPFDYIKLNNKLTLYAKRDATDQLRARHGVSVTIASRELVEGVYVVTAHASIGDRVDESIGAVDVTALKGEFRANAMMKAETKAKRRVTLSIVGLGWLDETEVETVAQREKVEVDTETGEIKARPVQTDAKEPSKPASEPAGASTGAPQAHEDDIIILIGDLISKFSWKERVTAEKYIVQNAGHGPPWTQEELQKVRKAAKL